MKNIFKHYSIIYWSVKAKKYNDLLKMYRDDDSIKGLDYIYATGLMVVKRDECLHIVQSLIGGNS